ncbi:hypothetical protein RUM43_010100 [Polyplax serrata]|uniref:Apolipoprotein D n=1 Tax=Polyplax serrata TaxID=468196 RepID=A0AAN8P3L5_POLSC
MIGAVSILLVMAVQAYGHTYHLGDCPAVKPMENFDINRFLGKWYVIQKTATGSSCLVNNYTEDKENPGHYKIEQVSDHLILGLTSLDHKYHYTGDLVIPNESNAAAMRVRFPLNVAGGASYTVFMTDYDTYAGIFTCQKLAFAHRKSATIISRSKTLGKDYVDKIRNRLSSFGVDPYDLSIIKQDNCTEPTENTTNISIDEGTFSKESVAQVFRKAGEKLGDGYEFVADSAKKVYTKVRGDHIESSEQINSEKNLKDDAEWLP